MPGIIAQSCTYEDTQNWKTKFRSTLIPAEFQDGQGVSLSGGSTLHHPWHACPPPPNSPIGGQTNQEGCKKVKKTFEKKRSSKKYDLWGDKNLRESNKIQKWTNFAGVKRVLGEGPLGFKACNLGGGGYVKRLLKTQQKPDDMIFVIYEHANSKNATLGKKLYKNFL